MMLTTFAFGALLAAAPPPPTPAPAPARPAAPAAVSVHSVELPGAPGAGAPKEAKTVLDNAHVKLAAITLRKGTLLPEHKTPLPVTIVAAQGAGHVLLADGSKQRLDATHMVVLAPNVPHAVQPDAGTDMVVLVHHLKTAGAAGGPEAHDGHEHHDSHDDHGGHH